MEREVLHSEKTFKGYDSLGLFYQSWVPVDPSTSSGSIVIVHGVGEHSSRYAHVGVHFAKLGYPVYAYDQRGNGRSPGRRGHIKEFNEYILDLKCFLEHLSLDEKIFILGHSLGGLIAIRFAMDYPEIIAGIVVTSPALGLSMEVPILKKGLAYTLNLFYPEFTMIDDGILTKYISHDPKVCDAYDNDPLIHRMRSSRFFVEFVKTYRKTAGEPHNLKAPCLFLQAGDDRIVSVEALKRFYGGVSAKDKSLKIYPNFYHEILNEAEKMMVFKDIELWLDSLSSR